MYHKRFAAIVLAGGLGVSTGLALAAGSGGSATQPADDLGAIPAVEKLAVAGAGSDEGWAVPPPDAETGRPGHAIARKGQNASLRLDHPFRALGFWEDEEGMWLYRIRYRDTVKQPATVSIYRGEGGQYGWHHVGTIGGAADNEWKTAEIYVPSWLIGTFGTGAGIRFRSTDADLPVETVQVLQIPDENLRAAQVRWYAAKNERREELARQMPEQPFRESTPLEPVAREHRELGFIPFVRSYLKAVYPNTVPTQEERGQSRLALVVAPGEAEPALFGVRALDEPLEDVRVSVTAGGAADAQLPDEAIELGVVEFAPIRWGGGSSARSWQTRPTRIWPIDAFPGNRHYRVSEDGKATVPANTTAAFWLTVRPARGTKPGTYHHRVEVRAGDRRAVLPLEVHVLPFELAGNDKWWLGMYISDPAPQAEVDDMAGHGVNATSQWPSGYRIRNDEGRPVVEFPGMTAYMRRLQGAGITGPHVFFGGNDRNHRLDRDVATAMGVQLDTPEYFAHYAEVVRQFHAQAQAQRWNPLVWCIFDEPSKGGEAQERWLGDAKAIREHLGDDVRLFMVNMNRGPQRARQFLPYPDIWSCNGAIEEMVALAKEHGGEVWSYGGASHRLEPADPRFNYGFNVWRSGTRGRYAWAYNWSAEDPLIDLDGDHMDWNVSFYGPDGRLVPSPAWEGFREGADDLRYLLTAMALIERNPDHPKAQEARQRLEEIGRKVAGQEDLPDKTGIDVLGGEFVPADNSVMTWARGQLIEIILTLREPAGR